MKRVLSVLSMLVVILATQSAHAAFESRFDAVTFKPTTDGGFYFTVSDSDTLDTWQGNISMSFDYANRPLQFSGTGGFLGARQSVIDHMATMNLSGAVGITDWFSVGIRVPIVLYNWFYSDEPVAAPSGTPDKAGMPGDVAFTLKFKALDIKDHKIGIAVVPYVTIPTGDERRYTGIGNVSGGGTLVFEFAPIDQLHMAINAGALYRDNVTRHGVTMGPQLTFGAALNWMFHKRWAFIVEGYGTTTFANFWTTGNTTLETGGGIRHIFGNSGFSVDAGGYAGLIDGVGNPRYRGFVKVNYNGKRKAPPPPPDPRIQGNKIVLWGKIFFDTAKATIKPISYPVLDDVVDVLVKNPHITLVEVQGHTDHRGSDSYNMGLSRRRAASALQYLVQRGISPTRLRSAGYGESRPIATNQTKEGMSQNRRTEFVIINSTHGWTTDSGAPDQLTRQPEAYNPPAGGNYSEAPAASNQAEPVAYDDGYKLPDSYYASQADQGR